MTTAITFIEDKNEALESPLYLTEGETRTFACTFWGVPSSVTTATYRSTTGTGVGTSVTVFAAGSVTVSGNTATLTAASGFTGRATYRVNVSASVSSSTYIRYFDLIVRKDEAM